MEEHVMVRDLEFLLRLLSPELIVLNEAMENDRHRCLSNYGLYLTCRNDVAKTHKAQGVTGDIVDDMYLLMFDVLPCYYHDHGQKYCRMPSVFSKGTMCEYQAIFPDKTGGHKCCEDIAIV